MKFVSHSQAGQDLFCWSVLGGKTNGVFVDVGCSHPIEISNTYALEQIGWYGVLVDSDQNAVDLCNGVRRTVALCADATKFNWDLIRLPKEIDFASVDIDEHTSAALENILGHGIFPAVLCVEHDFYSRGERLRTPNRELLTKHGYDILVKDVYHDGCSFEDWVVRPESVDMSIANKFKSEGLDWKAVLAQGGIET